MVLHFGDIEFQQPMTRETFLALSGQYPDFRIEREADGKVVIMSTIKRGSSKRESRINFFVQLWAYRNQSGEAHGSNGGFDLPNGAIKMPDAAWISPERLASAPFDSEEEFIKIIPDFVAEVRSSTDKLKKLQSQMTNTWMANGVRLAWLIDPYEEKAYVYRQGQTEPEVVAGFTEKTLSGEDVMPGFELPLKEMMRG
jgi:Uma2 family endonuclease